MALCVMPSSAAKSHTHISSMFKAQIIRARVLSPKTLTPAAVMDAWMNSSGHRANILNASYTQIGVGYLGYVFPSGTVG